MRILPGIVAHDLDGAEVLCELRVVDAAVAAPRRDQLHQRHPHAVLHRDRPRRLVHLVPPVTGRDMDGLI